MAKKTTTATTTAPVAPEHTTVTPLRKNIVRLTADQGWLLRSKNTGKTAQSVTTAHVAGYDVIEAEQKPAAEE